MKLSPIETKPKRRHYDVVIIGGAVMGSSAAWFLSDNADFDGSVLVVEKDPSYEWTSTARTNSCIRQQFSAEINIKISQFGAEFIKNFRNRLEASAVHKGIGEASDIPDILLQSFGYLYLAGNETLAGILIDNQELQTSLGAETRIMTPAEIAEAYPFYNLEGVILGAHNLKDEGYFDGATMFDWWRRMARLNGIDYVTNEVVSIQRSGDHISSVTLSSGEVIGAGTVVNASGPRAATTAKMAGLDIPVEPRRRYTFVFDAQTPLDRPLPLTIDPSGVHMRSDGQYYLCGCPPDDDPAVAFDDFHLDHDIWETKLWPVIAARVPAFEAVKVINSWIGHYAFNTLDQNAVVGPHPEVRNFLFVNGFSGHGFQQSPAMGRGISELIAYGSYRELDLSPLGYERIAQNEPFLERAII